MSLPYAVAAAIVFRANGLSAYAAERRRDPELLAMIERVTMVIDRSVVSSAQSSLSFHLRNGTAIEEPTAIPLGAPENPVDDKALMSKFVELAGLVVGSEECAKLGAALIALDRANDMRALVPLLRGGAGAGAEANPP
jgi:2-methylcitrate dehydratase PrpD